MSSLVEFFDSFLFFDSLDTVELDLTFGTSLETTNESSQLFVVVKVVSEGINEIVQFRFVLKIRYENYFFSDFS